MKSRIWCPNKGFRTFGELLPPKHRGGVWTFKAAWKGDDHAECKIIDVGADKPVVVSQWTPAPKKPWTTPLQASRGWQTHVHGPGKTGDSGQDVPITQLDEDDEDVDDPYMTTEEQADADMSAPGVKRGAENSPEKPKSRFKTPKVGNISADQVVFGSKGENGPENLAQWDLGGYGDCGFRCVAAAISIRNRKSKAETEKIAEKLALSLRTKSLVVLQESRKTWQDTWLVDPEMTEITEDGEVPQDVDAYLQACKRKGKWFDSWLCWAAAQVIETPIVVFKFIQKQWIFLQRFDPDKGASHTPIALFLKQGHFKTLDPSISFPVHWKALESKDVAEGISFLGGVKRGPSSFCSNKKDDQKSSCSSWLKPPPPSVSAKSFSSWLKPPPESGVGSASKRSDRPEKSDFLKSVAASFGGQVGSFAPSNNPGGKSSGSSGPVETLWEPPVFKKGRPPSRVKFRIWGKQQDPRRPKKWNPQMPWPWTCPIHDCRVTLKGTYAGVASAKLAHIRVAHPEAKSEIFRHEQPFEKISTSPDFPESQRAWSCPLCSHGLPQVPTQVRNRAIREHCKACHPDETPKTS